MSRDDQYLLDILSSARIILSYIEGRSWDDFTKDIQFQDAVIRRLEIIGEAARRVSQATQDELADLPWHEMTGMRNFVIHQYDTVDLTIIWDTVTNSLPLLVARLEKIIPPEE